MAGDSDTRTGSTDYATVAYDAATGSQLRVSRYRGPGNGLASTSSVAASPDGRKVFVTGQVQAGHSP